MRFDYPGPGGWFIVQRTASPPRAPESRQTISDAKYFLQVGDRVAGVVAGNPKLCATTSQQSSEVLCINQDPFIYCQGNHFLRSTSTIEIAFKLWIAIHLMKKVI